MSTTKSSGSIGQYDEPTYRHVNILHSMLLSYWVLPAVPPQSLGFSSLASAWVETSASAIGTTVKEIRLATNTVCHIL